MVVLLNPRYVAGPTLNLTQLCYSSGSLAPFRLRATDPSRRAAETELSWVRHRFRGNVANLQLVPLAAAAGAVLYRHTGYAATPFTADQIPGSVPEGSIEKARFPDGFLWGTATASYQLEGAWNDKPRTDQTLVSAFGGLSFILNRRRF